MEQVVTLSGRILMGLLRLVFGRAPGLRVKLVKALVLLETEAPPREALKRLFGVYDFLEDTLNQLCVRWGDGVHVKHELMRGIHEFFCSRIPPGSTVLDVGCGIGAVGHAIASDTDARVFGIDMNSESLQFARSRYQHPRLTFVEGDATRKIDAVGHVDVVVLSSLLEHLDDRVAFLKEIVRAHAPTLFLIRVPTFERHHFAPIKKKLGLWAYTDPTHRIEYDEQTFENEMRQAGLTIVEKHVSWGDIWAVCKPQAQPAKTHGAIRDVDRLPASGRK